MQKTSVKYDPTFSYGKKKIFAMIDREKTYYSLIFMGAQITHRVHFHYEIQCQEACFPLL